MELRDVSGDLKPNEIKNKTYPNCEENGWEATTDEALHGLVRGKLDQGGPSHGFAENEGHDVVDHDWAIGDDHPKVAFVDIVPKKQTSANGQHAA